MAQFRIVRRERRKVGMPQQPGGSNDLPQHVKKYFERLQRDPKKLPPHTRKAFENLTEEQVAGLDAVGDGLQKDAAQPDMYVYAVH
jgi:hypothetical protein